MLVVATLSDTLWFVVIAVVSLICPWAIAFLAAETRHNNSSNRLKRPEKYSLMGIWAISVLGLGAILHFGEAQLGEIFYALYMVLAFGSAVFTFILLAIAASKPE